jgi:hypothetical protein
MWCHHVWICSAIVKPVAKSSSVSAVELQNDTTCDVNTFEFVLQLWNQLQNPALLTAEKLSIDPLNPLMPYYDKEGKLGDALSGSVYYKGDLITNSKDQLFVFIIQWIVHNGYGQ